MCAPWVTRHTPIRDSSSCHTRVNVGASISYPYLKAQIIAAVKNIDPPMLTRVGQELEYHINVCSVICGAHIKHL
jgi:hypothetical protein